MPTPRAIPKPIPQALLARLAALDARCDMAWSRHTEWLERRPARMGSEPMVIWTGVPPERPAGRRRAWRVHISLQERPTDTTQMIDVSARALADALEQAVSQAEARGWHRSA